jgi:dTDP-4-amino-4,6-dideoxygalactose transaminase
MMTALLLAGSGSSQKWSAADLAIFGGAPACQQPLYVGRPNLGDRERFLARINEILDRRWLTNDGPVVQELEQRLASMLNVRHCVAVANATLGLQLMAKACQLSGDVIVPSFTFVATAHALAWQGLTPVFGDIDPRTHNLDPARVEALITPGTSAIMGVHLWGRPCDVDALGRISRAHGLKLLFDAAHALGCSYRGAPLGGAGDAEVFSFHATKFFNSLEGGAITTNDDALADRFRAMRNFGYRPSGEVVGVGINAKMNEISAAMGLTSLDSIAETIEINHRNRRTYLEYLHSVPGVTFAEFDSSDRHNYQYVVVEIDERVTGICRDDLHRVLNSERIRARRYFSPPCHQVQPYNMTPSHGQASLANTEQVARRVLQLPTGTAIGPQEIAVIADVIRFVVSHGEEITRSLPPPDPSEALDR